MRDSLRFAAAQFFDKADSASAETGQNSKKAGAGRPTFVNDVEVISVADFPESLPADQPHTKRKKQRPRFVQSIESQGPQLPHCEGTSNSVEANHVTKNRSPGRKPKRGI